MVTGYTVRCFILVSAAGQLLANTALTGIAGGDVFTIPLVPALTPNGAATYYACDWQMTPSQRTLVESALVGGGITYEIVDRDHWDSSQGVPSFGSALNARGMQRKSASPL